MTLKPCAQTTSFKTNRLLKEYWELGAKLALLFEIISLGNARNKHFLTVHQQKKKNIPPVLTVAWM